MSGFKKISGVVSAVKFSSSTSTKVRKDSYGNVIGEPQTKYWVTFRVNNTPCRLDRDISLSNGDQVTIVGKGMSELKVLALSNKTTNIMYEGVEGSNWFSIYLAFFIAIILIGLALWMWISNSDPLELLPSLCLFLGLVTLIASLLGYKFKKDIDYAIQMLQN